MERAMEQANVVFVNGYGATHDLNDGNYRRYLGAVREFVLSQPGERFEIFLAGGFTNRQDISEADTMCQILLKLDAKSGDVGDSLPSLYRNGHVIFSNEEAMTARGNLKACQRWAQSRFKSGISLTIFCEHSRRWTMRFLASRFFRRCRVIGVRFDAASLTIGHRLKQLFLKLPLEVAAFYVPLFDRWRLWLRRRHVARCRAAER